MRSKEEIQRMFDEFVELRSKERSSEFEVALLDRSMRVLSWVLEHGDGQDFASYEGMVL